MTLGNHSCGRWQAPFAQRHNTWPTRTRFFPSLHLDLSAGPVFSFRQHSRRVAVPLFSSSDSFWHRGIHFSLPSASPTQPAICAPRVSSLRHTQRLPVTHSFISCLDRCFNLEIPPLCEIQSIVPFSWNHPASFRAAKPCTYNICKHHPDSLSRLLFALDGATKLARHPNTGATTPSAVELDFDLHRKTECHVEGEEATRLPGAWLTSPASFPVPKGRT